ncbi:hypothetical protein J1G18_15910, partial [Pseudomonas sp. MIS38]|uniref:hypothetical protein n=1 Tax=Pseudomonas sp. MIS38 TaxID=91465 RepID=UPI001CA73C80
MKGLADARPFLLRVFQGSHHSPVGSAMDGRFVAGRDQGWEWLLTKGPAHSALLLADPTLSRASP